VANLRVATLEAKGVNCTVNCTIPRPLSLACARIARALRVHREELMTRVPLGETHGSHRSLRRDVDLVAGINGNPKATKVSELIFVL